MIRLALYVLLVAAAVIVAVWFANDPGTVSIEWRGWRLDTSVGILIVLVGLLVLAVLAVVKVVALIRGSARAFGQSRRERKATRGMGALADGFAALYAGDIEAARKAAREARSLLDDNPATLLLSARTARRAGEQNAEVIAATLLDRAGTELAGLRDLAESAAAKGDASGARTYGQRALARKDAPGWALDLLLDLEIGAGNWAAALAIVDGKIARRLYQADKCARLAARFATLLAEQRLRDGDAPGASDAAHRAVDAGGGDHAIAVLCKALIVDGKAKKAAAVIEKAWPAHAGPELLAAYKSVAPSEAALEWVKRSERLAATAPSHPESLLAAAAAALRGELWGQARTRLAPLLGEDTEAPVRARAARMMAEIEQSERGDAAATINWLKTAMPAGPAAALRQPPRSLAEALKD